MRKGELTFVAKLLLWIVLVLLVALFLRRFVAGGEGVLQPLQNLLPG